MSRLRFGAREAYWLALAAVFAATLYYGWPGHLSVDSVLGLHEGRFGVRETWNPALFGWLLGVFDRIHPGTGLYITAFAALLALSWAAMALIPPRTSWIAPVTVLILACLPQVVVWQAIVWKDIAFANTAIGGFVALALGLRARTPRGAWAWFALSALLFAAAGLYRQNGLLAGAAAAVALGWARTAPLGWRRAIGGAIGWIGLVLALTFVLSMVAQPQGIGAPDNAGSDKGVRILQTYDLIGAEALAVGRRLENIDRVDPEAGEYIRWAARRAYSPERVDEMIGDKVLQRMIFRVPGDAIRADWIDLVTDDPGLYLKVRAADFRWVFATPVIDKCLPVHLGVAGPPKALAELRMPERRDLRDQRLYNYITWYLDTPAMSHVAYAAAALILGVLFLVRRGPGDLPMAGLMAAALAFTASFLPLSLACDYRYLYFLDLAAITGVIWFALDPTLSRRAAPRPAAR